MANLTLTLADDLLRKARLRAVEQGTSVNAVIRAFLEDWTETNVLRARALDSILRAAADSCASSEGRRWTRDELYRP